MSFNAPFTKDNLDLYLSELAKEFRKLNGKTMPAEIILIVGASILVNYGFREMTYDMDAIISASWIISILLEGCANYRYKAKDLSTNLITKLFSC